MGKHRWAVLLEDLDWGGDVENVFIVVEHRGVLVSRYHGTVDGLLVFSSSTGCLTIDPDKIIMIEIYDREEKKNED